MSSLSLCDGGFKIVEVSGVSVVSAEGEGVKSSGRMRVSGGRA